MFSFSRKLSILGLCLAGLMSAQTAAFKVGFRVSTVGGVRTALWYPTNSTPVSHYYLGANFTGTVAPSSVPGTGTTRFPLVVFSHGNGSCGIQSIFFTEELARRGFVVAAPDHKDATCGSDGSFGSVGGVLQAPYFNPYAWTDETYVDRKSDVTAVVNALLADAQFAPVIDAQRIGISGPSLGG